MVHKLWETHEWETAATEEVVAALFDDPRPTNPRDFREIEKHHSQAKSIYLNLFYSGQIPGYVKKINEL
jgi:hypothetical protein